MLTASSLIKSHSYTSLFSLHGETITHLVAKSYEDATHEFTTSAISGGHVPHFEQMGRWWDKNTEIDLVGLQETDNAILFVETKWNTQPIDTDILDDLKRKSQQVIWGKPGRKEYFVLVAKGGFTQRLITHAKQAGVVLIHQDTVI